VHGGIQVLPSTRDKLAQARANRLCHLTVDRAMRIKEAPQPSERLVNELIHNHEMARSDLFA